MRIEDIIRGKGAGVVTVEPGASVEQLVGLLGEHRIGAVVVSTDGVHIEGIVSERDVVRELGKQGAEVLQRTVGDIMTANVHTCGLEDTLEEADHRALRQALERAPRLGARQLARHLRAGVHGAQPHRAERPVPRRFGELGPVRLVPLKVVSPR